MQTSTKAIHLLLASIMLASGGCSLSRNAPPQQHYVLGEGSRPDIPAPAVDSGVPVIGLRPPRLAAYLDNPYIVVRGAPHRVAFSEFHRWGEDLTRGISRAVSGYLAARAPSWRIEVAPWESGTQPDYVVQLHLSRFEGVVPDQPEASVGEAHLRATWEIFRRQDGALLSRGTTEVREPGWTVGDFDELVSRLDQGLAALAEALRADLQRVLPPPVTRDAP